MARSWIGHFLEVPRSALHLNICSQAISAKCCEPMVGTRCSLTCDSAAWCSSRAKSWFLRQRRHLRTLTFLGLELAADEASLRSDVAACVVARCPRPLVVG